MSRKYPKFFDQHPVLTSLGLNMLFFLTGWCISRVIHFLLHGH